MVTRWQLGKRGVFRGSERHIKKKMVRGRGESLRKAKSEIFVKNQARRTRGAGTLPIA